jgi:hypothetical protein
VEGEHAQRDRQRAGEEQYAAPPGNIDGKRGNGLCDARRQQVNAEQHPCDEDRFAGLDQHHDTHGEGHQP